MEENHEQRQVRAGTRSEQKLLDHRKWAAQGGYPEKLSYLEVVQIAFPGEQPTPQRVYTVTFSNPHGKDGTMVEGQEEVIKDDIIFNVTKTDQS